MSAVTGAVVGKPARGYEAEVEARLAIGLIIRHVEGVALAARDGKELLPAATTLARAAYEGALRTLWMLHPDEPFERERRWLTHMRDTERFYGRTSQAFIAAGETEAGARYSDLAERHRTFRLAVEAKLPTEIERPLPKLPSLKEMTAELGQAERYLVYRMASQYAHATHVGTRIYRKNLGINAELGDFTTEEMWRAPFLLSWFALEAPVTRVVDCSGGDSSTMRNALPSEAFAQALSSLREA